MRIVPFQPAAIGRERRFRGFIHTDNFEIFRQPAVQRGSIRDFTFREINLSCQFGFCRVNREMVGEPAKVGRSIFNPDLPAGGKPTAIDASGQVQMSVFLHDQSILQKADHGSRGPQVLPITAGLFSVRFLPSLLALGMERRPVIERGVKKFDGGISFIPRQVGGGKIVQGDRHPHAVFHPPRVNRNSPRTHIPFNVFQRTVNQFVGSGKEMSTQSKNFRWALTERARRATEVSAHHAPHRSLPPAPALARSCWIIFHSGALLRRLKPFIQVVSGWAGKDGRSFGTGAGTGALDWLAHPHCQVTLPEPHPHTLVQSVLDPDRRSSQTRANLVLRAIW